MNSMLGRTMLERKTIEALLEGKTEEIRFLLEEKGPEFLIYRDGEGQTPLMLATENGDADMARFLLKQGASPNDRNNFGQSSVHYACFEDQPEILQLLLDHGGDVNIQDDDIGQSPLHDAAEAANNHLQIYRILLRNGTRINVKNDDGNTPLHLASIYGRLEATQLLLDQGADLLVRNKQGQTPLDVAADVPTQTALRMHRYLQTTRERLELLVWRSAGGGGGTATSNNNRIFMPTGNCSDAVAACNKSNNNPLFCSSATSADVTTTTTPTSIVVDNKDDLIMEQLEIIMEKQKEDLQLQFSILFQQNRAQKAETVALRKLVEKQHEQHKLGLAQLSQETNEKLDLFLVQLLRQQRQQQANTGTDTVDSSWTMSCRSTGGPQQQQQQQQQNFDLAAMTNRMDVMTTHFMVVQVMLIVMTLVYLWNTKRFAFRVSSTPSSSSSLSTPSCSKKAEYDVAKPTLLDSKSPSRNHSKNGNSRSNTATTTPAAATAAATAAAAAITVSSPTTATADPSPALVVAELQEQVIQYQAEVEEYKKNIAQLVLVQKKLMMKEF